VIREPDAAPTVRSLVVAAGLDATGATDNDPAAEPATATEYRYDPERTVGLLAGALARLHRVVVPAGAVPELRPADLVDRARTAVAAGRTTADMAPAYAHMAPDRLVAALADGEGRRRDATLVLTHGAPTLGRLICVDGAAVGFTGWDDAAVSDPYRDLAVAAADVAGTLGPMLVPVFFERYGDAGTDLGAPDPVAVDWYVLAAQFGP
jgi:aminoglycoside phosphotransferase